MPGFVAKFLNILMPCDHVREDYYPSVTQEFYYESTRLEIFTCKKCKQKIFYSKQEPKIFYSGQETLGFEDFIRESNWVFTRNFDYIVIPDALFVELEPIYYGARTHGDDRERKELHSKILEEINSVFIKYGLQVPFRNPQRERDDALYASMLEIEREWRKKNQATKKK